MKKVLLVAGGLSGSLMASAAMADTTGVDYSSITGAFSAQTVITGILAVGAVLATVYVAKKGLDFILGMMKSKG